MDTKNGTPGQRATVTTELPVWLAEQIKADPKIQRQLLTDQLTEKQARAALRHLAGRTEGQVWAAALAAAGFAPAAEPAGGK